MSETGPSEPVPDMRLMAVLRRMQVPGTAHRFRSIFRDGAAEFTAHPSEVAEMALAHPVCDKVEAAYRRGNLFDKQVAAEPKIFTRSRVQMRVLASRVPSAKNTMAETLS